MIENQLLDCKKNIATSLTKKGFKRAFIPSVLRPKVKGSDYKLPDDLAEYLSNKISSTYPNLSKSLNL
jgi:hypothetical protein